MLPCESTCFLPLDGYYKKGPLLSHVSLPLIWGVYNTFAILIKCQEFRGEAQLVKLHSECCPIIPVPLLCDELVKSRPCRSYVFSGGGTNTGWHITAPMQGNFCTQIECEAKNNGDIEVGQS